MMIKFENIIPDEIETPRGGNGFAISYPYKVMQNFQGQIKTFNMMVLEPKSSIGLHQHYENSEVYLLLDGNAIFNDNGKEISAEAGDLLLCEKGNFHGITNNSKNPITFLAFILE